MNDIRQFILDQIERNGMRLRNTLYKSNNLFNKELIKFGGFN